MKTATLAVAAAVVLTATFANADQRFGAGSQMHHRRPPMPAARGGGHFELRTVQQWVDGFYEQVYVAPVCTQRGYFRHCTSASYQQVYRPGHYVNVEQWVFVPDFHRRQYAQNDHRRFGQPPLPVRPQPTHQAAPARPRAPHQHHGRR